MNLPDGISEARRRVVVDYQARSAGPLLLFIRALTAEQVWTVERHPYYDERDRLWRVSLSRAAEK